MLLLSVTRYPLKIFSFSNIISISYHDDEDVSTGGVICGINGGFSNKFGTCIELTNNGI